MTVEETLNEIDAFYTIQFALEQAENEGVEGENITAALEIVYRRIAELQASPKLQ